MRRKDLHTGQIDTQIKEKLTQKYVDGTCGYATIPWVNCYVMEPTFYGMYVGIQNDPLSKTNVQYHVRQNGWWDSDDKVGGRNWFYYRVSDLVIVYVQSREFDENDVMTSEGWTEYMDGGRA